MKVKRNIVLALLALTLANAGCSVVTRVLEVSPPTERRVVLEKNVMVPMRDGVRLATDV